jgi:hypothetical protein
MYKGRLAGVDLWHVTNKRFMQMSMEWIPQFVSVNHRNSISSPCISFLKMLYVLKWFCQFAILFFYEQLQTQYLETNQIM